MDWIAPIITSATSFVTGLVTMIVETFTGLFIDTAAPSDLAMFLLSMLGIVTGYFVIKFTYNIISGFISKRKGKKKARA